MVYADTMGLNSTGKVKWAVLDSCSSLNSTTSWMFMPSFNNGLHMLLGWDTDVAPSEDQSNAEYRGEVFARLLQGIYQGAWNQRFNMSEAWKLAGFFTYNSYPGHSFYDVYDAVMYASNCADDSLPGWGPFCTNPQGPIYWDHQLVFANTTQDQMNSQIVNLEVDGNSITVSIPVASDKAMMYIPVKSVYTKEWASSLAKSLGMSGDIRETEDSFYANDMDTKNNVFIVRKDASLILFQKFGSRSGIVQSDAASVSAVNKFLLSNNLMPPGYPEPRLMKNDGGSITQAGERKTNWITNVISYQQVLDGLPVIGAQFNVEVDSGGNIVGLIRNWREYEPFKEISQKKPDDVLKEFRAISLRNAKDSSEKVIVTGVLLGYRMQRSGDTGEYLQPVYIFKGHYKNGDSIKPLEPVIIDTKEGDVKENTTSPIPTTIRKTETTYNITQNTTLIANTSIVTTQNVTIPKISSTIDPIVDWNNEIENTTSDTFNNLNFTGNLIDNSSVRSNKTMNNGSISGNISENVHNGR
jgi:hypothetical protein